MKRRRLRQSAALILSMLILALTSLGLAGSAIAEDDNDDGRRDASPLGSSAPKSSLAPATLMAVVAPAFA